MESRRSGLRSLIRPTLLASLLTLTLGSAAQTPVQWQSPSASNNASGNPTARTFVNTAQRAPAVAMPVDRGLAYAPPPARIQPVAGGFDVARFEQMAQALVANQRIPGLAVAIVQNGRIVSARGYGITDVKAAEPVDAHTVFRLASLSKSFAGTLTGMLVSEGALRWDSKVSDFMPNLRFADPGAAQQLTVAEVLSHRVGLTHNAFDRDIEGYADYREVVRRFSDAPMK